MILSVFVLLTTCSHGARVKYVKKQAISVRTIANNPLMELWQAMAHDTDSTDPLGACAQSTKSMLKFAATGVEGGCQPGQRGCGMMDERLMKYGTDKGWKEQCSVLVYNSNSGFIMPMPDTCSESELNDAWPEDLDDNKVASARCGACATSVFLMQLPSMAKCDGTDSVQSCYIEDMSKYATEKGWKRMCTGREGLLLPMPDHCTEQEMQHIIGPTTLNCSSGAQCAANVLKMQLLSTAKCDGLDSAARLPCFFEAITNYATEEGWKRMCTYIIERTERVPFPMPDHCTEQEMQHIIGGSTTHCGIGAQCAASVFAMQLRWRKCDGPDSGAVRRCYIEATLKYATENGWKRKWTCSSGADTWSLPMPDHCTEQEMQHKFGRDTLLTCESGEVHAGSAQ